MTETFPKSHKNNINIDGPTFQLLPQTAVMSACEPGSCLLVIQGSTE